MVTGEASLSEHAHVPEISPLQKEYARCTRTLSKTGMVSLLPHAEALGIIGIDGKEYPIPSAEEVQELFDKNKEVVDRKTAQGFTRLQLTPFGAPLSVLADRVKREILKHDTDKTIFQAKRELSDPNTPVTVDRNQPVWMWDSFVGGDTNGNIVYFPQSYDRNNRGLTKEQVIQDKTICPTPGWSVGLVEPSVFFPQPKQGKTIDGRSQFETNSSPQEYLRMLASSPYKEETGFTPEDFLVKFVNHLSETNQVSHDWNDNSAAWLTASYLPNDGCVPDGRWDRSYEGLDLGRRTPGARSVSMGGSSTVRLSI